MLPWHRRIGPVVAVLLGAPISAELLQAYLGSTGDAFQLGVAVVFLAPLYGGAALLIREVRCGPAAAGPAGSCWRRRSARR